ncbi:MAG: prepilin-type N-terminal cleavage/methylation domain-containing protein [Sedimentisphaerales bacterium]|nr:prepilin-type N-terminal cleavage/methylation domain-containing protein [Sedimentisphaerales bacterium]
MNPKCKAQRKAFSLVELVIVIVILGVIAAIAIPRISSGSRNAGESALRANLASLRNAIDWYYGEHKNTYPGVKDDGTSGAKTEGSLINQLVKYSNADGTTSDNKSDLFPYGPYLRGGGFPKLPVGGNAGSANVTMVDDNLPLTATPADGCGWSYNLQTGQIIANSTDTGSDNKTYDTY